MRSTTKHGEASTGSPCVEIRGLGSNAGVTAFLAFGMIANAAMAKVH